MGDPADRWRTFVRRKRLRESSPRNAVVEAFLAVTGHVDLDKLLVEARSIDESVSAATVYRTMRLLVEAGAASEHHFGASKTLYEPALKHHDHLVCLKCGAVIEFESNAIEQAQNAVAKAFSFRLVSHRHELYGHCSSCQSTKPRSEK